jgi:glutaredoxin
MNSLRRAKKLGPIISSNKRGFMMGSTSPTKGLDIDKDKAIWIGIIILIFIMFTGSCYYNGDTNSPDTFSNIKSGFNNIVNGVSSKMGGSSNLKELDIIYFKSPTCPWCKKMDDVLIDSVSSITVVDVTTPEGQKIAKDMGAADKGIPSFISKKMQTGSVGFKPSVKELIDSLNKTKPSEKPVDTPKMDPSEAVNKVQELDIILFVSPSCGWCSKIKGEFSEAGVLEMVEMVDVSTDDGKNIAKELLKEFRGVPALYSKNTGKSVVGYKPLPAIIEALL